MQNPVDSFLETVFSVVEMGPAMMFALMLLTIIVEFSFFIPAIATNFPYFPFTTHFTCGAYIVAIMFFTENAISIPTIIFTSYLTIFVFFRMLALFLNDTQDDHMAISSLFYSQTSTILTPLSLDFLQAQSHRAMALNGKLPEPKSAHGYNSGLNEDMIAGGFVTKDENGKDGDKPVHYGLATLSEKPPKIPVLLVLAHPDDESMFFTPLLHALSKHNDMVYRAFPHMDPMRSSRQTTDGIPKPTIAFERVTPPIYDVHLLCLTNGDADGLGNIREKELIETCTKIHHIPRKNIEIVNDPIRLPDSMTASWNSTTVENYISDYIEQHGLASIDFTPAKDISRFNGQKKVQNLDEIGNMKPGWALHHMNFHDLILISFDNFGVSSHINHISCYKAANAFTLKYNAQLVLKQGNLEHEAEMRSNLDLDNDNDPRFASSSDDDNSDYNNDSDDNDDERDQNEGDLLLRNKAGGGQKHTSKSSKKDKKLANKVDSSKKSSKYSTRKGLAYRHREPITKRYITLYGVETIPLWMKYLGPYSGLANLSAPFQAPTSTNNHSTMGSSLQTIFGGGSMAQPHSGSGNSIMMDQTVHQGKIQIANISSLQSWVAMSTHWSQWVWFRKLFVLFSTYSYVTPLVILQASPIHPGVKQIGNNFKSGMVMD